MPLSTLLVEGELDIQLLYAVFRGHPVVEPGGSKNGLAPEVRRRRQGKVAGGDNVAYLRDRDFDFDPPSECIGPTVDRMLNGNTLGWRWCRHEIENYLLEPDIVCATVGCDRDEYASTLTAAAKRIRHYEIARWAIGTARRGLPPNYELATRPSELNEIAIPEDVSSEVSFQWGRKQIGDFNQRVRAPLSSEAVNASLAAFDASWTDAALSDLSFVLTMFSGKDLMAAIVDWLRSKNFKNAGEFRATVRDWFVGHVEDALSALSEWRQLKEMVSQ